MLEIANNPRSIIEPGIVDMALTGKGYLFSSLKTYLVFKFWATTGSLSIVPYEIYFNIALNGSKRKFLWIGFIQVE